MPLTFLSHHPPRPIDWLWPDRIPLGKPTLLLGDPDSGKSFLALDLAARITRGHPPPASGFAISTTPNSTPHHPANVLLLAADDDPHDTLRPRLERAHADLDRIALLPHFIESDNRRRLLSLHRDLHHLAQALDQLPDCRLIIIDPVTAFLGHVDANNNVSVRHILLELADLASQHRAALLLISHQRKQSAPSALYRALGSLAFTAVARSVLMLVPDPATHGRRLLLPVKSSLHPAAPGRAFRIIDGRLDWEPHDIPFTADELHLLTKSDALTADPRQAAVNWLRLLLTPGPVPSDDIHRDAHTRGIPKRLLWEAKKLANIRATKDKDRWYWQLPPEPPPNPLLAPWPPDFPWKPTR